MALPHNLVLLSIAVRPKTPDDARKLTHGLKQLSSEDATIQSRVLDDHVVVGGTSEEQLEIAIDRLKREFQVSANLGRPEVEYREAIMRMAEAEAKHTRHGDSGGEYAHVKIRLYPGEFGSGYHFENRVAGGAIPERFIGSVDQGIRDRLAHGVVVGYAIADVRVLLDGGSYHDVDSSEVAFRIAGSLAAEQALRKADPVLLEPMMDVRVVVPAQYRRDVIDELVARRGRVESVEREGSMEILRAVAPLASLLGYSTDLRARTRGEGTCSIQFHAYMPYRGGDEGRDDTVIGARLRPRPDPKSSSISLPAPDDDAAPL